jgi:hypothetical protein
VKSAKFLIAENPIVDDGRVFVIHLRDPVIIAEAFHFHEDQESEWMRCKSDFNAGASVDYPGELIFLGVVFCAPLPKEWTAAQDQADKLAKIMSRMGDWYHNYLKWEDSK